MGSAWLSSILQGRLTPQDRSRITTIRLAPLDTGAEAAEQANQVRQLMRELRALAPRIWVRAIDGYERFQANVDVYRIALLSGGAELREADQLATLLGARDILMFDNVTPEDAALAYMTTHVDMIGASNNEADDGGEGRECLDHLLSSPADVHRGGDKLNRHGRFRDSDILRKVFEEAVSGCMSAGLVGGEGFAVDASVIEANASRFQRIKGAEVDWTPEQHASRPVQEYLVALESENPPINPKQKPKAMSPSDPCAAWTRRGRNKVMFGYSLNYLIDMENAVILDVEATPTRISKEVDATLTMIERTEERFGLKPDHIAGDVAYGTGEMLGSLIKRDITPHIPVWDRTEAAADGIYSRTEFTYDANRNLYICPGGKELKTSGTVHDGASVRPQATRLRPGAGPCGQRTSEAAFWRVAWGNLTPRRSQNPEVRRRLPGRCIRLASVSDEAVPC